MSDFVSDSVSDSEGFVPVAGGRLWAQAAGEGTGVVLVHAGIADARMWDPQWEALAARHRVPPPRAAFSG